MKLLVKNKKMLYLVLINYLVLGVSSMDNLRVAYQWKQIDFDFPSAEDRQLAIDNKDFIPENNLPLGLEVYGDRMFITVPRWKKGVPASLTYIYTNASMESPKLRPYPNWEVHKLPENRSEVDDEKIISPFRVRADACGRLWILDSGSAELLGDYKSYKQPQLIIYNLHDDLPLRRYTIPEKQIKEDSFFATLAVEDHDCKDTYAYVADLGKAGLIVYSWKDNKSWRVQHHYFNIDPIAGNFNVNGIGFQWSDHLFGLALSAPDSEGYSTLYFHPMVSTNEFSVSTKVLRDEMMATDMGKVFKEFKLLGSRGPNAQSSVSFLDKNTGVLFYALINLNAIACWRTTNPTYNMQSQGRVYMSNETMVFPNDIKVDSNSNLWVLSDRLPQFMYKSLDVNDVNFRILTATVQDAIRGTACDSKLVISKPNLTNRLKPMVSTMPPALSGMDKKSGAMRNVYAITTLLVSFMFSISL